jgi:DNA-binding XRE family transcriptional regulator
LRPEQIAEAASILVMDVGRMERGDAEVRLDLVAAYAAALGFALTLRPDLPHLEGAAATPVTAARLAEDLERLRGEFGACREGVDLSPSALARYANLTVKTVFALERGPQIPKLSTALAHAERFGLVLCLCNRGERTPPASIREMVAADLAAIYERIGSATKSTSSHHLKEPRSEMEADVARVLSEAYSRLGIPHRAFARSIGLNWKTVFPEGIPSFTGRFQTTASVAARLGYRILAVPSDVDVGKIVSRYEAAPTEEPDLSDLQALDVARTFARRRIGLGHTFADVHRRGGPTAKTVRNVESNPVDATLALLCRYAQSMDLTMVAVPEEAAQAIRAAIDLPADVPIIRRLPGNGAARHFNPEVEARKRAIMADLCRTVNETADKAVTAGDVAAVLCVPSAKVEGLVEGRRHRARAVEFAGLLRAAGLLLAFEDGTGGFRAQFGASSSTEDEIREFFDRTIVYRQGLGLHHEAAGIRIGISGSRLQHMELGEPKILTTSLMLYAEALGLAWRVEKAADRAA